MDVSEMLNIAEEFGCRLPVEKSVYSKVTIAKSTLDEFGSALETLNSYKEDFPDELLRGLQDLAEVGLENIYKKASKDKWPSLS